MKRDCYECGLTGTVRIFRLSFLTLKYNREEMMEANKLLS